MSKKGEKARLKLWARGLIQLRLVNIETGKLLEEENKKISQSSTCN